MNRIHYFCSVVQTGSIVKASELLNISQPALSKAIKTLESEIGKKLILPSGRGISITDFGRSLYEKSIPILNEIESLKKFEFEKEKNKQLKIATFEVFSTYFLGKVISEEFDDYNVGVLECIPGEIEKNVSLGNADIGITYLPIPQSDLDILKIVSVKMGVYGAKNKFKNNVFNELPFVIPSDEVKGSPSKVRGLDGWPDHQVPRKIKYQVSMMETALDLCRRGKCVGYFPDFVIELHNTIVAPEFRLEPYDFPRNIKSTTQDVYMIKRKSDFENSHFKKISKTLRHLK